MLASLTTQRKTECTAATLERDCPICASPECDPHWQKGDLRIVRCRACGMVYVNPAPAGMASGQFYDAEGVDYYLSPAKLESDYADVRFERELRLFRRHCPRGAVLDVGCSSGAFLFQLQKRWPGDYEILGTDVSGPPLDYAESRGVPVVRGNFLELDFGAGGGSDGVSASASDASSKSSFSAAVAPHRAGVPETRIGEREPKSKKHFNVITFWAVLEHLAEPKQFLDKAHAILKPGGLCFVLVPNLKSLAVRLLGPKYRYILPQHLNYFTASTLDRLAVNECGFRIVESGTTHFNPLVIWQDWRGRGGEVSDQERARLLQRTTRYKQSGALKPARWALTGIEAALRRLQRADNLFVVLRKPA